MAETAPAQKAVLVTGASSGLDRAMTEAMAAQGYFVYAGARKDKGMEELTALRVACGMRTVSAWCRIAKQNRRKRAQ